MENALEQSDVQMERPRRMLRYESSVNSKSLPLTGIQVAQAGVDAVQEMVRKSRQSKL